MIVNISSTGNHTNQIYQFIQLDSFCKEKNIKYINLQLYKLFPYFSNLKTKYQTFFSKVFFPFLSFIILCLCKLKIFKFYNLTEKDDCIKLVNEIKKNPKKNYYTKGWSHDFNYIFYKSEDLENKYRNYYSDLFYTNINSIRNIYFSNEHPITIGLHIRRGDYKEYKNGIYYYSDETYISVVNQLKKLLNKTKINLIVFTNDKDLNHDIFKNNFSKVSFSKENFQTDYQLLANCNYIIGAPSSFTMWASFIGQVPLYHIKDSKKKIALSDFTISAGL